MSKLYSFFYILCLMLSISGIVNAMPLQDFKNSMDLQQKAQKQSTSFYFSPDLRTYEKDSATLNHMINQNFGEYVFRKQELPSQDSENNSDFQQPTVQNLEGVPILPANLSSMSTYSESLPGHGNNSGSRTSNALKQRTNLLNSSSYYSSVGKRIPVNCYMQRFVTMAKQGNIDQLKEEIGSLKAAIGKYWRPAAICTKRYNLERRKSFVEKLMDLDIVHELNAVKNGTLQEAEQMVYGLEYMASDQFNGQFNDPIYLEMRREAFVLGRKILEQRLDYQQKVQKLRLQKLQEQEQEKQRQAPSRGGQLPPIDYKQALSQKEDTPSQQSDLITKGGQLPAMNYTEDHGSFKHVKEPLLAQLWGSLKINHPAYSDQYKIAIEETIKEMQQEGVLGDDLSMIARLPDITFRYSKGIIKRLNPVVQAKDIGMFTWDVTKLLADCMVYLDPRYDSYRRQYEGHGVPLSQIDPEKFISTLSTVNTILGGPLGLVDHVTFMKEMQPIIDKASELTAEEWGEITGDLLFPFAMSKGMKVVGSISRFAHPEVAEALQSLKNRINVAGFAEGIEAATIDGLKVPVELGDTSVLKNAADKVRGTAKGVAKGVSEINQSSIAILKNGYYEVNGFRFSEYYYNRLWNKGRGAPSLIAKEIIQGAKSVVPDVKKTGFFRYECGNWEMVYNPDTKEVWHLMQIKQK